MTPESLRSKTRKELADLAKSRHVAGWHGMRKDELVEALLDVHSSRTETTATTTAVREVPPPPVTVAPLPPAARTSRRTGRTRVSNEPGPVKATVRRDISTIPDGMQEVEELTVVAHDPNWLHARWTLKRSTVQRAVTALGYDWHAAKPVIRVYKVEVDEVRTAKSRKLRDVEIHGDVDHWFVPVEHAPAHFRLEIGYVTAAGRFFPLAKSRRVTTPRPGSRATERPHWNVAKAPKPEPAERPESARGAISPASRFDLTTPEAEHAGTELDFEISTELFVTGNVTAGARLSVFGEPVRVGSDGRFSTKVTLSDGRLVMPAVAVSPDGSRQRTVVIAIERNTKELEPRVVEQFE